MEIEINGVKYSKYYYDPNYPSFKKAFIWRLCDINKNNKKIVTIIGTQHTFHSDVHRNMPTIEVSSNFLEKTFIPVRYDNND